MGGLSKINAAPFDGRRLASTGVGAGRAEMEPKRVLELDGSKKRVRPAVQIAVAIEPFDDQG
jgi:hypothetical protein